MTDELMRIMEKQIACTTIKPTRHIPDLTDDVRKSLLTQPRSISPKYFYDKRGSDLFDQICSTPEYYPTRVESQLLAQFARAVIAKTRPVQIMELGSGYSVKTRHLFDACEAIAHHCIYAPFDVCEDVLVNTALQLSDEYEWLNLNPLLGDYHGGLGNLPSNTAPCLFVFLGSTIGNFERADAVQFMQELSSVMRPGDHLLLGVDRVKPHDILNAAYNDRQGVTAAFNLNVLQVLNKALNADFNPAEFMHSALFNAEAERIEMRLIANSEQQVHINDLNESVLFSEGEDILTEISQKYTSHGIDELFTAARLTITDHYEDEQAYFSLILATK